MVEKRGRKPKAGERYPCGKRRAVDFRSEAQFQRMKETARLLGLDPIPVLEGSRGRASGAGNAGTRERPYPKELAGPRAPGSAAAGRGDRTNARWPEKGDESQRT